MEITVRFSRSQLVEAAQNRLGLKRVALDGPVSATAIIGALIKTLPPQKHIGAGNFEHMLPAQSVICVKPNSCDVQGDGVHVTIQQAEGPHQTRPYFAGYLRALQDMVERPDLGH